MPLLVPPWRWKRPPAPWALFARKHRLTVAGLPMGPAGSPMALIVPRTPQPCLPPPHHRVQYGATVPKTVENFVSVRRQRWCSPGCGPFLAGYKWEWDVVQRFGFAPLRHRHPRAANPSHAVHPAVHAVHCSRPSSYPHQLHPFLTPALLQRALCTGEKGTGKSGKPLHFKASWVLKLCYEAVL